MAPSPDPILLTGCSSGIGHASAAYLIRAGHTVYATARQPETLADLAAVGARTLALDVTDEESMQAVVSTVEAEHGRVGTLVNNAGYGVYGTIEETDLDTVRTMFDTNVFGLVRMTQLVLPGMRAVGAGRIINIGSMGGRFTFPVGGFYHATKYAVESLTDALRQEVSGFGIDVSLIEPGPIRTKFEETILESVASGPGGQADSPYAALVGKVASANAAAYASKAMAGSPESVARVVLKAVESERPRIRYVVTPGARALITTKTLTPDRVWDSLVRKQIGY